MESVPSTETDSASTPAANGFIGANGKSAASNFATVLDFADIFFVCRSKPISPASEIFAMRFPALSKASNEKPSIAAVPPPKRARSEESTEIWYSFRFATE